MITPDTDDVRASREQAYAAYDKAVQDAIKNALFFGGILAAAVWWFSSWTWTTRVIWSVIGLSTVADLVSLPVKIQVFRHLQANTSDTQTRRLHLGMLAVTIGADAVILPIIVWSGVRLW